MNLLEQAFCSWLGAVVMFLFISTNGGPATWLSVAFFVCTCVFPQQRLREAATLVAPWVAAAVGLLVALRGTDAVAAIARPLFAPRTARTSSSRAKLEEVIERVKGLRTNTFTPIDDLSVRELLTLAKERSLPITPGQERKDLVARVKNACATSHETCVVCSDDFVRGDILRVLPTCRHTFHLECLDRWAYSTAARGTTLKCPICSAAL